MLAIDTNIYSGSSLLKGTTFVMKCNTITFTVNKINDHYPHTIDFSSPVHSNKYLNQIPDFRTYYAIFFTILIYVYRCYINYE